VILNSVIEAVRGDILSGKESFAPPPKFSYLNRRKEKKKLKCFGFELDEVFNTA